MKKTLTLLLSLNFILIASVVTAQTEPIYEQYHFNQLVINPAYCGSKNSFETDFFIHRQDIKMPGAPSTESFTFHAPLASQKLGLGFKFYHDHVGVTDLFYTSLVGAYQMYLGEGVLSAGLEFSINSYQLGYEKLDAFDEGDPAFTQFESNIVSPNAGIGIYFRNENFYAGLSALNILEKEPDNSSEATAFGLFENARHYNINSGCQVDINPTLSLLPHALVLYTYGGPLQVDLNLDFIFDNSFRVGGGYKTNKSISILAEYVLDYEKTLSGNEFSFGYAYNFMLGDVQAFLGPTHEIFLGYRFNKHNTKIRSPRFF